MYQFSAHMQSLAKRLIKFLNICQIRPNDASNAFKTVPGDLQDRSRMDSLSRFIFKGMHDENEGRASKAEHPRSPHEPPTMFPRRIQGAPKKPSQNALIETTFLFVLGVPKRLHSKPAYMQKRTRIYADKKLAYMQDCDVTIASGGTIIAFPRVYSFARHNHVNCNCKNSLFRVFSNATPMCKTNA